MGHAVLGLQPPLDAHQPRLDQHAALAFAEKALQKAHGKPRDTPVAIVRRASWPQQRTMLTTLGELPTVLAPGALL